MESRIFSVSRIMPAFFSHHWSSLWWMDFITLKFLGRLLPIPFSCFPFVSTLHALVFPKVPFLAVFSMSRALLVISFSFLNLTRTHIPVFPKCVFLVETSLGTSVVYFQSFLWQPSSMELKDNPKQYVQSWVYYYFSFSMEHLYLLPISPILVNETIMYFPDI